MKYILNEYSFFDENYKSIIESCELFAIYVDTIGMYFSNETGRFMTLDGYYPIDDFTIINCKIDLSSVKKYDLIIYESMMEGNYKYTHFEKYFDLKNLNPSTYCILNNLTVLIGKKYDVLDLNKVFQISKNVFIEINEGLVAALIIKLDEII